MQADDSNQYQTLVDCLARRLVSRSTDQDTVEDLAEFASYLASELWPSLPPSLQTATYENRTDAPSADEVFLEALSPSFIESLLTYSLIPVADADADAAEVFTRKVLEDYIPDVTAPPPIWKSTRTAECEMCDREVPLTYHHLIPRSTHAKVLKKGWHHESMLNSVAWLCRYVMCQVSFVTVIDGPLPYYRPCHSAVHHAEPNDVLAKEYYTVDLLLEREDLQKWTKYISKQRWKPKPYRK
jgi:hypothetical protein